MVSSNLVIWIVVILLSVFVFLIKIQKRQETDIATVLMRVAIWPPVREKSYSLGLSWEAFIIFCTSFVYFASFPLAFQNRMWVLTVFIRDHCQSFCLFFQPSELLDLAVFVLDVLNILFVIKLCCIFYWQRHNVLMSIYFSEFVTVWVLIFHRLADRYTCFVSLNLSGSLRHVVEGVAHYKHIFLLGLNSILQLVL